VNSTVIMILLFNYDINIKYNFLNNFFFFFLFFFFFVNIMKKNINK